MHTVYIKQVHYSIIIPRICSRKLQLRNIETVTYVTMNDMNTVAPVTNVEDKQREHLFRVPVWDEY